jgi:hypothetical protein
MRGCYCCEEEGEGAEPGGWERPEGGKMAYPWSQWLDAGVWNCGGEFQPSAARHLDLGLFAGLLQPSQVYCSCTIGDERVKPGRSIVQPRGVWLGPFPRTISPQSRSGCNFAYGGAELLQVQL